MIIRQRWIARQHLQNHRDRLYLFGDNVARQGYGGQAKEMRGEPNAVGIRTKNRPSYDKNAFWTDKTYEQNIVMIYQDLEKVWPHWEADGTIVIPTNGIGTGRAMMQQTCPLTFKYLQWRLSELGCNDTP